MITLEETIAVLLILFIFSVAAYKKKALDFQGVLLGNIFGIAVFLLGGITSFIALVVFFAVAETATAIERKQKPLAHGKRSIENIIGNGLPALVCLFFNAPFAFYGAVSAALSDTLSSEIGVLSKKKPVLITTFKPIKKGTDGGITARGYLAAFLGAVIIAGIHFAFFQSIVLAVILAFCGLFGSTIDSLLGAIFERKKLMNNTVVNFFGSGSGAVLAFILGSLV